MNSQSEALLDPGGREGDAKPEPSCPQVTCSMRDSLKGQSNAEMPRLY